MPSTRMTLRAKLTVEMLRNAASDSEYRTRTWLLDEGWNRRLELDWTLEACPIPESRSHTFHRARLEFDCPRTARPRCGDLRLTVDVATSGDADPAAKARRVLDLAPSSVVPSVERRLADIPSFASLRPPGIIGPMTDDWPVGRRIVAYNHHLGSYGQGGVGLSGWQLNGGSWMVLPLKYSANWITFTREGLTLQAEAFMLDITIDQRIIDAHPNQIADFPPWDHRFAGTPPIEELPDFAAARPVIDHFESRPDGFRLDARIGHKIYRFAMGDHLPQPAWAGSGGARMLGQGESVAGSFLLAHDCYLTL